MTSGSLQQEARFYSASPKRRGRLAGVNEVVVRARLGRTSLSVPVLRPVQTGSAPGFFARHLVVSLQIRAHPTSYRAWCKYTV